MRGALLTVLSAGAFLQCLDSATLPPNPCSNLFQYQQDRNGGVFGRVMLNNDYSGYYDIAVNMSIAAYLVGEQNLKIEMVSTLDDILAGCPIVYNISFPIQGVIPRLTRIELNNKVYCTDPSEELRSSGVTEMWAAHYYRTNQPPKRLLAKPKQTLHPRCTLLKQQPPLHNPTTFSSNSWQQPLAAPTAFELSHSSTWKPPVTGYNMNAPLTSWSLRPWSKRPSSTAATTSASLSSNTLWEPSNPCPNWFQYQQDKNGDVFGRVMLGNDYSGYYDISVNMSIAAYLVGKQNLKIEMESTLDDILAGCPLVYNISFPIQGVIPRLTRIELNNKVYCTGPSEELGPRGVTEMWAGYYYRTNQPPKPLSVKPEQKLHPRCALLKQQPPLHNSTTSLSSPWQQPSAAPTTSALSSSSTWKPHLIASNMNAPLTSWSRRPSSTAPTTSASLSSNTLRQPSNPCPNLFQYQQGKDDVFGRVMLHNDYSGDYSFSVNMSIAAYLVGEQNLGIEMESTLDDILAGCPLVYNITFPIQGVIPRLTRIELNNKVYCTGPSEELGSRGVTEMWAAHYYRTNQPPKPLSAKPNPKLHPNCALLTLQPPFQNSTIFPSEPWRQPSTASTTSTPLSSSTWQPPLTASTTDTPLPSRTSPPYLTIYPTPASSSPWQQPSAAPTTSWKPWPQRPSSTATSNSASLSSNTWWQPSETTTTAAPLSSNTWQSPSTASTTSVSLILNTWQQPSTDSTTSASMSSEPSMHSPKPIPELEWLSLAPSVTASTAASLIEEFSLSGKECGLTMVNSRLSVIEGDDFVDGEYPWLVAIMYRSNVDWDYRCTGSLVSNRHVITAGHCVKRKKKIENFLLVFGTKNLSSWVVKSVQRELQNISIHPDYADNKDDANVAILTVKTQIKFEAGIKPLCLFHGEEYVNRMAGMQGTVVGWWMDGKRKFIDAKKIDLPIVSQTECMKLFSNMSSVISSRTFCAGLKGAGPCHGDSGAGFAMQRNGRWALRGVVFTAVGDLDICDDDIDNYFVFVDVDKVMSWLKKVMT